MLGAAHTPPRIEVFSVSSAHPTVVVLAIPAADALALVSEQTHVLAPWLERVTAVAVGVPDDVEDADRRGAEPTVLVASLARRFPSARWFAAASLARDFPYNVARRIGSLSNTTGSNIGVALVPGATHLPTTRPAGDDERVTSGATALRGLWESWPLHTIVADRESRIFVDSTDIVRGEHDDVFSVRGPLQVPVDAARIPPLAVWARHPLPGTDLAFDPRGLITGADGRHVGTIVTGTPEDSARQLREFGESGLLAPLTGAGASLRDALGLPPATPVLVDPPRAFPEAAVLQ